MNEQLMAVYNRIVSLRQMLDEAEAEMRLLEQEQLQQDQIDYEVETILQTADPRRSLAELLSEIFPPSPKGETQ